MLEDPFDPRPRSRLTLQVRRDVIVDAAAYRAVRSLAARPDRASLVRIEAEVTDALRLFEREGWLDAPETYHQTPPPPTDVRSARRRSANLRYTTISWLDGYRPRADEPGAGRFLGHRVNRVARASLLEHRSGDRPWLLCLHGFAMGRPGLDLRAFRALHLHRDLGLNLAFLTLPFHGRRNPTSSVAPPMPSADALETVHGLSQAVWDTRQLVALLRARSDMPIGVMGLSLGGLVASITASLDQLDAVGLLVPAVDLPTLAERAASAGEVGAPAAFDLLARARPLYAPISPLRLKPRVPAERSFIVAGTLDRFVNASTQVVPLWRHWNEPELHWYHGGHASLFWAPRVQSTIDRQLTQLGLCS